MVSHKLYIIAMLSPIFCAFHNNCSANSDSQIVKVNLHAIQDDIPVKKPIQIGILHTLSRLSNWAWRDEAMAKALGERLEITKQELQLIKSYLEDYKKTSGNALANVLEPKETPEERGKVIGSSAVLSHAMTHRYTSTIQKLKDLWESPELAKNRDDLEAIFDMSLWGSASESSEEIPVLTLKQELRHSIKVDEILNKGDRFDTNQSDKRASESNYTVGEAAAGEPENEIAYLNGAWPSWKDKYMSLNSFTRIMEVYGFHAGDLRQGLKFDTTFGASLNSEQCAELGVFALYQGHYYNAIEWLELAKAILVKEDGHPSTQIDLLSSLLDVSIQEHNIGHNIHPDDRRYEDYYVNPTFEGQNRSMRIRGRSEMFKYYTGVGLKPNPHFRFYGLCSGLVYQTPAIQKTLKCYYENKRHPYLYINPVKTEVLSESPPIFQFYEMIGNKTIEQIKEWTVPYMQLSQIVGKDTLQDITRYRTSFGASLDYYRLPKLYELGEIITGLKIIGTSEYSQVAEYVYGRYYGLHSDALEDEEETLASVASAGDRMATLLYYMETGEFGGKTPFPLAGVSAHQVRGSAILWFNLYHNGTARRDTVHGACPVIHGSKLIVNHWIRAVGNWNTYKCSLNQFE